MKPGVKRSGTPGWRGKKRLSPLSGRQHLLIPEPSPVSQALEKLFGSDLGFRFAPPQALRFRSLRELQTSLNVGYLKRLGVLAILFLCSMTCLAQAPKSDAPINITVALDGSGQFKSVQEAIMSVPAGSPAQPVVIHIKPGTYKELIYIQHEKRFFRLVGEDAAKTILTYDLHANMIGSDQKPIGTFRTPSTLIDADDVSFENLTFENSAGPVGQALAIRVDGDRVSFRRCRFLGWQDTILLNRGRQYFEDCYIAGHVDFIFGAATAWFERCHIHCLKNGYITAASTYDYQPFGFVFSHCKIDGEPEVKTYLGRPWRDFSNVIYLNTEMSDVVRPEGWQNWNLPAREKTARYSEYNSKGPGADLKARVSWSHQLDKNQAKTITIKKVLRGEDGWNPSK
jgi:pectinesterase